MQNLHENMAQNLILLTLNEENGGFSKYQLFILLTHWKGRNWK